MLEEQNREHTCVCACVRVCVCAHAHVRVLMHSYTLSCASVVSNPFVTSWTVGHQAPLSMELSRQEYWWVAISYSTPYHIQMKKIQNFWIWRLTYMVAQSHHFQKFSFQTFQYLNATFVHLLHFKLLCLMCLEQINSFLQTDRSFIKQSMDSTLQRPGMGQPQRLK